MKTSFSRVNSLSKNLIACGAFTVTAMIAVPAFAQGVPEDWSDHHLIFSNPGTISDAVRNGTVEKWKAVTSDPRYKHQLERRAHQSAAAATAHGNTSNNGHGGGTVPSAIERDWSVALDQSGYFTVGAAWQGSNQNSPGSLDSGECIGISTTGGVAGITTANISTYLSPGQYLAVHSSGNNSNGTDFEVVQISSFPNTTVCANGSKGTDINLIRGLFGTVVNSAQTGATISANIRGNTEDEIFPAKYAFNTGVANCTNDFVVYHTFEKGASGNASLVGFNNNYTTGCTGTLPNILFSYNTGGQIVISPVLSYYGNQVAFVQTTGAGTSSLVILKWVSADGASGLSSGHPAGFAPVAPAPFVNTTASEASFLTSCRTVTVSTGCMISFPLGANNSRSSPFVDYKNDTIYVGDDSGKLHKIINAFESTTNGPSEPTGWPVTVSAGNKLGNPVYDVVSQTVLVGAGDGKLYRVDPSGVNATVASAVIGPVQSLTDPNHLLDPIVDSWAGRVYLMNPAQSTGTANTTMISLPTNYASGANGTSGGTSGVSVILATSATVHPHMFSGQFDNSYYSSADPTNPSGSFYICGGNATGVLSLYRIPVSITSGAFSFGTVGTPLALQSTAGGVCSPASEFYDSSTASTTLSAAITTTTATSISVTSATGFSVKDLIKIDSEIMLVTAIAGTNFTVTRAQGASTAATHLVSAGVTKPARDLLFVSTTLNGNKFGCTGACLYTFDITSGLPTNSLAGLQASGGTTGVVVDSREGATGITGTAQIYYTPLSDGTINGTTNCVGNTSNVGNVLGACAIQASQAALQ